MMRKIFRIILFLLFLEIFLRTGGFVSLCMQDFQNHFDSNNKKDYRILCVGESITMSGYPQFLEEILNRKHFSRKFQVINKGISGVTTDMIMNSMDSYLKKYKPDMVIAMMGLNDSSYEPFQVESRESGGTPFKAIRFFYDLRVCKLFRGIYKDLKIYFSQFFNFSKSEKKMGIIVHKTPQDIIYDERPDYSRGPSSENVGKAFQLGLVWYLTKDYADAEHIFKLLIEDPDAKIYNSKSKFIYYLALVQFQESNVKELMQTIQKVPYWNWFNMPVVGFCNDQENAGYVTGSLKKLYEDFPNIPFYPDMASQCYAKLGDVQQANIWKAKAMQIKENQVHIRTKLNYLKLLDILKKKNIMPVLMQYPLEDVESLKAMVQSAFDDDRIIFIDNNKVFEDAVRKDGYDAIFTDYYAGNFGHLTPKGNRIFAENIAQKLINDMGWK